ncbi:hypothetical protein [Phenylobacterium aquaticum]|nr:hypothetical protein [Phenylobacterium aquaticum]
MRLVLRLLLGVIGLAALMLTARLWLDPAMAGAKLGVSATGPLGLATLRADLAGFFGVVGGLTLAAAIRADARLLTAPMLLIGAALAGRVITVLVQGLQPEMVGPMVVEAVLVVILAFGRRSLVAA